MTPDVEAWLDGLSPELTHHAQVLRRLAAAVEADPRLRILVVGCSVGRGVADALSDLDMALGVADDAWPDVLDDIDRIVRLGGAVVDVLHHRLAELGDLPHRRSFVQYVDGVQLDLVVQPVSCWKHGRSPDMVVLHDLDGRTATLGTPPWSVASADDIREWTFLGWAALADCDKYLRRSSPWEALERLHSARTQLWRLWAVALGVGQPLYGVTAILDAPGSALPPGIEETLASANVSDLRRAVLRCAELLSVVSPRAMTKIAPAAKWEPPLAAWVTRRLQS